MLLKFIAVILACAVLVLGVEHEMQDPLVNRIKRDLVKLRQKRQFGRPGFGGNRPGFGPPRPGRPGPGFGGPGFGRPGIGRPGFGRPGFGR